MFSLTKLAKRSIHTVGTSNTFRHIHTNPSRLSATTADNHLERRVVVTGLGWVTPMGNDIVDVFDRLRKKETGIRTIEDPEIVKHQLPVKVAATVGPLPHDPAVVPLKIKSICSRFEQYAITAAHAAMLDSGFNCLGDNAKAERAGVAIGSGIGCVEEVAGASALMQTRGAKRVSAYSLPKMLCNLAAGHVSILHNLQGPNHAVSTACATGSHAIGDAFRFIKSDDADVMLAGGAESGVSALSLSLFSRIHALSRNPDPQTASRPFARGRDGFVMSEGACVFVLEELEHARQRGAHIYCEVVGYGLSGDAHHVTSPPADGRGAMLSMRSALRNAGLQPEDVDYVNAHATSTPLGDRAEAVAMSRVFKLPVPASLAESLCGSADGAADEQDVASTDGATASGDAGTGAAERAAAALGLRVVPDDAPRERERPYVSSTKGALGHMLGAAGAVEAALCVLSVARNELLPVAGCTVEELGSEFSQLNVVTDTLQQHKDINVAMSNSFGFGGSNASLVFRRYQE